MVTNIQLFGTAQERQLLPEKVPFRLTRMMTNALELAGSHGHEIPGSRGSYKQASIVTMGVLRDSRSSLLAMLEAFLYDPLLSWTVRPGFPVCHVADGSLRHRLAQRRRRHLNQKTVQLVKP